MTTTTEEFIEVHSPYSGDVVGRAPKSGAEDARRAVDAAAKALESPLPAHERAAILDRTATLLRERQEEMAQTICAEAGKPIKTARVEASRAVSTYTFAAVEARKLTGDVVPMEASEAGAGKIAFTLRRPIGVIGAISPFPRPRGRLPRRSQARERHASLGPSPRGARARRGAAGRLAHRSRRAVG